jgi:hypothetical protein
MTHNNTTHHKRSFLLMNHFTNVTIRSDWCGSRPEGRDPQVSPFLIVGSPSLERGYKHTDRQTDISLKWSQDGPQNVDI